MKFTVTIDCGNAAFEGDLRGELTTILIRLLDHIGRGADAGILADSNGNTVGSFAFLPGASEPCSCDLEMTGGLHYCR